MQTKISKYINYIANKKKLAPSTISAYKYDIEKFKIFLEQSSSSVSEWNNVNKEDISTFLEFLSQNGHKKANVAPSCNRKIAVLKSFFNFLYKEKTIPTNPAHEIRFTRLKSKKPSMLKDNEYTDLIDTIKKTATKFYKFRDLAMISLLSEACLKVSELVNLNMHDLDINSRLIEVNGRSNGQRKVKISSKTVLYIQKYLNGKYDNGHALFLSKKRKRISKRNVQYLVKKYLQVAGVKKDKLSPNILRNTFKQKNEFNNN